MKLHKQAQEKYRQRMNYTNKEISSKSNPITVNS